MLEEKYLRSGIDIVEGPGIGRRIVALVVNVTHEFLLFLSLKKKKMDWNLARKILPESPSEKIDRIDE